MSPLDLTLFVTLGAMGAALALALTVTFAAALSKRLVDTFIPYSCGQCEAFGVKLWREYNSFFPSLFCCKCAGENQGRPATEKDYDIGWLVLAVPVYETFTDAVSTSRIWSYWGYCAIPADGLKWWRSLPSPSAGTQSPARREVAS